MIVQNKDNPNDKTIVLGTMEAVALIERLQAAVDAAKRSTIKEHAFSLEVEYERGSTSNPGQLEIAIIDHE